MIGGDFWQVYYELPGLVVLHFLRHFILTNLGIYFAFIHNWRYFISQHLPRDFCPPLQILLTSHPNLSSLYLLKGSNLDLGVSLASNWNQWIPKIVWSAFTLPIPPFTLHFGSPLVVWFTNTYLEDSSKNQTPIG